MNFEGIECGPKMLACTERERRFIYALVLLGAKSAAEAARLAGYSNSSHACEVRGFEAMHRDRVLEGIEELTKQEFRALVPHVVRAARNLVFNDKHPDHARTISSLLSRMGYGERESVNVRVSGEVVVNHVDAAVEDLRKAKLLGFPREQLEAMFGFSGLERYEKMLTEADRGGRVIEHAEPASEPLAASEALAEEPATGVVSDGQE